MEVLQCEWNSFTLYKELSSTQVPKARIWHLEAVFGERLCGKNLVTIPNYEAWKERRRVFDPAFNISYLRSLVPMFNQVIKREGVDPLEAHADGKSEFDMVKVFNTTTLEVISWAAFGANFSNDEKVIFVTGGKDLRELLIMTSKAAYQQMRLGILSRLDAFSSGKYREAARMFRAIGRECIQQRIKAMEREEETPHDILSLILSICGKEANISFEDLVDEFAMFYFAGQETTSSLLAHSLAALLKYPEIMRSVVEEIDDVLGDKQTVSFEDLEKLTYLHQVMEESLRLWPPVPYISKSNPNTMTLCGYRIPKNASFIISSYNLHRSPKYFDDPLKFDPCRFGPGQKRPSPYTFLPFGLGNRTCIGKKFAMMEAQIVLALLLQKYTFQYSDGFVYKRTLRFTIQPSEGIPCTIRLRNKVKNHEGRL